MSPGTDILFSTVRCSILMRQCISSMLLSELPELELCFTIVSCDLSRGSQEKSEWSCDDLMREEGRKH